MADDEVKPELTQEDREAIGKDFDANRTPEEPELPLAEEAPAAEAAAEVEPVAEVVEPEPEPKPDWKDKELKKKHAQIMEARRQLEAKDAEIAAIRAGQTTEQPVPVPPDQVKIMARQLVDEERYIESCNKANESGQKTYGTDWKAAVETLETLGGFDIPTMRGIMATGSPDKALYQLGKNPDEYHRIMDLPIERRIVEITKLVERPSQAAKPISQAPAPVRTVGGTAAPAATTLTDGMDDDKWFQARRAQRRAKWERENGIRR